MMRMIRPASPACSRCWRRATYAQAQERILSYDSDIQVRADGSLDVTEHIARARRRQQHPPRHLSRFPDPLQGPLSATASWSTSRCWACSATARPSRGSPRQVSNGVRINTGNDDFLPVPADYTYTLHYRTTRQLGFFADHDELYWNAIGTGWDFPIERGSVEVRLPPPVPARSDEGRGLYRRARLDKRRDFDAEAAAPRHRALDADAAAGAARRHDRGAGVPEGPGGRARAARSAGVVAEGQQRAC